MNPQQGEQQGSEPPLIIPPVRQGYGGRPAHRSPPPPVRKRADNILPLWETEKLAIEDAITSCGGNIPKAAALLGISASTIYRKRQHWESLEAEAEAEAEAG